MQPKGILFLLVLGLGLLAAGGGVRASDMEGAKALFEASKFEEAKKQFLDISREDPRNAEAAYYLGTIFLFQQKGDQSIEWCEKAVSLESSNSRYHHRLGQAYGSVAQKKGIFKAMGLAKKTKQQFKTAVELDPDNVDARWDLMQYYMFAPGIAGGSKKKAAFHGSEIKKRDQVRGHMAMGLLYQRKKNYDSALKAFILSNTESKKQGTRDRYRYLIENAINNLGYVYLKKKKTAKAIDAFKINVREFPDSFNVYDSLGEAYMASGDTELAIRNYQLAMEKNPKKSESHKKAYARASETLEKLKGS